MRTSLGWGKTEKSHKKLPYALQSVKLQVRTVEYCKKSIPLEWHYESMLCAGGKSNRSICTKPAKFSKNFREFSKTVKHDIGGPLTYWNGKSNQHILIGVASWVEDCGKQGSPSVFVRISSFRNWIKKNMKSPTYCKNNGTPGSADLTDVSGGGGKYWRKGGA